MKKDKQLELVVEILDQDRDWGRDEFIRQPGKQGREIRVLSLGDSRPPVDDTSDLWLDLTAHAKFANEAIQEDYPRFLYEAVQAGGLLDITVMDGKTSLYWFMPISEMSLLRNPLINKLYALLVLKSVLKGGKYKKISLILDDPLLEMPARQIADEFGAGLFATVKIIQAPSSSHYRRRLVLIKNWWLSCLQDLAYWMVLRAAVKRQSPKPAEDILALTIFPTLWDEKGTNRAFGDLPDELERRGHGLFYLAIPTLKLRELVFSMNQWRVITSQNQMAFLHSYVSLADLLRAYLRAGWGFQLSSGIHAMKQGSFQIDQIDVTDLLHRELDQEAWETAIPLCMLIARAAQSVRSRSHTLACAVHAFEFQPIEKAFTLGVKMTDPRFPVIGLQTALIGKSHLGYRFLPEQVPHGGGIVPPYAPLPDYVATYGTAAQRMLEKLLGPGRVVKTGPIRYPYLRAASDRERRSAEADLKQRLEFGHEVIPVMLALTSLQRESETIMKWALNIGRENPELYFLVRYHYWADLSRELETRAAQIGFTRYEIAQGDLHQQMLACRLMITGTSSIGVEAMVSGCMPVVYRSNGMYAYSPVEDVAEGVYFFSNEVELKSILREGGRGGRGYQARRARWPLLLERHCSRLDGRASSRFYVWLHQHGVLQSRLVNQGNV